MRRILPWSAASLGLLLTVGGCMMPAYRMPAGFSSSYYRHLYSDDPRVPARRLQNLPDHAIELTPPEAVPARSHDGEVIAPEDEQSPLARPAIPIEPDSHPSPPVPLPGTDAGLQQPPSPNNEGEKPAAQPTTKSLPNTAMSVKR